MRFLQFDNNFYPADVENEIAAVIHGILADEVGRMILYSEKVMREDIMEGIAPMGPVKPPVLACLN